jgi:hypothetical protein
MNVSLSGVEGAMALLRSYGVEIRFADLGEWGRDELRSEYDPAVPEIRINLRLTSKLGANDLEAFVAQAIGHELYHHREATGEVAVLRDRCAREAAANAYAVELMEGTA